ncbi:hypothetical protein H2198_001355 [Neophaeococcomyces mojaviensis]|uniref:Uncharacterized protein n=1 Tax=Neophaeococcomyces mojaviensis TaxID=3383035 RepID=A0ACC3AH55_9EURO|nr:hypothetical protein H2198_001355 [Knufia sp. JES_112]
MLGGRQDPYTNLNFCNVSISYTHPGWNDVVTIVTYLPFKDHWNGKFMATGGGGYVTGGESIAQFSMIPGLVSGYAVSTTDGGHQLTIAEGNTYSSHWALSSIGNVNWPLLVDFAHVALHDMATVGKAAARSFYGSPARYSYFFGGSTGGRQGHMLAQRYPKDFDGIIALFPAMNWARFLFANIYPTFVMDSLKAYPKPCEIQSIQKAALAACDELDGLVDGMISKPGLCHFDPHTLVGETFECNDAKAVYSFGAAEVAAAAWNGPRSAKGDFQWYGFAMDANISQPIIDAAVTECDDNGKCAPVPFAISDVWVRYWLAKDPSFDMRSISHEEWDELIHASISEYESVIGTSDPDLSQFKKASGKMLNWHGMADQAIPFNGSVDYYEKVMKLDAKVHDFYRLFLATGASHCMDCGIVPPVPDLIRTMERWVEHGKAPKILRGVGPNNDGIKVERDICMYPRVQHYVGGDPTKPDAFVCV